VKQIEETAIPGPGSCGGMYTANTMASAIEALGMSLPNSSAQNAVSQTKAQDCHDAGVAVLKLLEQDIKPSDIMTRKAFENAITLVIALGGSTNAVLHLLAMANTVGVELSLDDFTEIGKRVPVLADLRPSGQYMMSELVAIGGIQPLMKMLLERGLMHGDCLTVTGRTLAENLADVEPYPESQDIIHGFNNPIKSDSHLRILYGNLSPTGSVAKITGKEGTKFTGTARCFQSEEEAQEKITDGTVIAGDVVVIRYEGPKGRPRHARNAHPHLRHHGPGPRPGRGPDHRRPLLRRQPRLRRRPRHPRSGRRRPHRPPPPGRRHHHHRRRNPTASTSTSATRN